MSITVRVAHINVHQPANDATRRFNIDGVVGIVKDNRGVGTLNEIGKQYDHQYIRSLKPQGIGSFVYGSNGIIWDARRFDLISTHKYRIMVGGHVGADGKPGGDDRRVGPSRWLLVAVLKDRATGITFQSAVTHLVAKADTQHKWRRGIRQASINITGLRLSNLNKKYPQGFLNGDTNFAGGRLDFPYLPEEQLPLLRTLGGMRYDRAFIWGTVRLVAGSLRTFKRKSDHLGFVYTVTIGAGKPVRTPPAPRPRPKMKRPVRFPWRRRSRRWKRRHPILWKRIVKWRRLNPRKRR